MFSRCSLIVGADVLAAAPDGDVVARRRPARSRTRCPRTRRRTPRPCSCDASPSCFLVLLGVPGLRTPAVRGSNRSAGAFSPRMSSTSAVMAGHDPVGRLLLTRRRPAGPAGRPRSTGSPAFMRIRLRGNRSRLRGVRRQQLLRAPLPDRDHRAAGRQRDPGRTGLAGHRPQVGVTGERALGVDDDALAGRAPRRTAASNAPTASRLSRSTGIWPAERRKSPSSLVLEQPGLREVARQPAVVVDEVRGRQRVDVRDVVDHHDAARRSPGSCRRRSRSGWRREQRAASGSAPPMVNAHPRSCWSLRTVTSILPRSGRPAETEGRWSRSRLLPRLAGSAVDDRPHVRRPGARQGTRPSASPGCRAGAPCGRDSPSAPSRSTPSHAARAAPSVAEVLVVTDDAGFAEVVADLGCATCPTGRRRPQREPCGQPPRRPAAARRTLVPVALCADLPCLRPADLTTRWGAGAAGDARRTSPTPTGTGTTLYTAPYDGFAPRFGAGSRRAPTRPPAPSRSSATCRRCGATSTT